MIMRLHTVVAIPVRNEEERFSACLAALLAQSHPADKILLLLNNCTDASLEIGSHAALSSPAIEIIPCHLHGDDASAGEARRLIFEHALARMGDGVILTTDADSVVPAAWIADNLTEIAADADAVCGMAKIVPEGQCTGRPRLEFDDLREALLLNLQDEIASIVDPIAADPWPRHQQNSGASIAVTAAILRKVGGAPRVAVGEDRALIASLALVDANIRHAPHIQVTVSGRAQGRAVGGMAETIARRLQRQDWLTDEMLEPTVDAYRRAMARAQLRRLRLGQTTPADISESLLISRQTIHDALAEPFFGVGWARIQRESPILQRRRVAYVDLARESRQAITLRDQLRTLTTPQACIPEERGRRHVV